MSVSLRVISRRLVPGMFALGFLVVVPMASAQDNASVQRRVAAMGNYTRAHALMIEALAEFDRGREGSKSVLLIGAEQWRASFLKLAERLDRVTDPKPRITLPGLGPHYRPRLIRSKRHRLPPVPETVQQCELGYR